MKRFKYLLLLSLIVVIPLVLGMASPMKMTDARERNAVIRVEAEPNLEIHEGYVSQREETVLLKKGRNTIARIHLSEPVVVAQAEQEEKWGYFQFPSIGRAEDGTLIVSWQMNADSHKAYGISSGREIGPMVSKDGGKNWKPKDRDYHLFSRGYNVKITDGRVLQIMTPKSKDICKYKDFPNPVLAEGNTTYYLENQLPEDLRGAYLQYEGSDNSVDYFHADLIDPGLLRTAIEGLMPVIWWGNIAQLSDGALVAGVYPTHYLEKNGEVIKGSVSFYRSDDMGKTWNIVGKIPFVADGIADKRSKDKAYEEPAFEVLTDGTFLCVMRTGSTSPMYKTISKDQGKTWSKPEPFTPNGVKPTLLRLNNGVIVLASGRPGVQLRFCLEGDGQKWTDPIEMIPYMDIRGKYEVWANSCGYTSILSADNNSFYFVYSDFKSKNENGELRKAIIFRKLTIKR